MIPIRSWFNNLKMKYQLMGLLTLLNLADFQTTKFLVDRLGFIAEANPLLSWAMLTSNSVYAILVVKVVVLSFLWWMVIQMQDHHRLITPGRLVHILQVLVFAFFALISWNYFRVFQELGFIGG